MDKVFLEIKEHIYLLQGIRSCNIYFLDFKKKAIIDTGFADEIESNIEVFKNNGLDLAGLDYIINTHSHGDHIGGNSFLKKINPDAKIIASFKTELYQSRRLKRNLLTGAEDNFPEYNIDVKVKENDIIDLGDFTLKALETPGHTIDSVSFYNEKYNIIFSGDVIYKGVVSQVDYYQDLMLSLRELKESYEKLLKVNASLFYAGHSIPIDNPNENIKGSMRKISRFERQPELIIINNFVPSAEYFIHKNPGVTIDKLKNFFMENMKKFRDQPFLIQIGESRFEEMIDKMIALMKLMNMIKLENDGLFLVNRINQNLNKG